MRSTPLLAALLTLSAACVALVPAATAGHCAQYALTSEVLCEYRHAREQYVDPWVDFALCFYNTAPAQWLGTCLRITVEEGSAPLLP